MTRKRAAAILLALAIVAALYLALPRPSQLVPYTSPPLNPQGERVSLLVPRGWQPEPSDTDGPHVEQSLAPRSSVPLWLRHFGIGRPEFAWVSVTWVRAGSGLRRENAPHGVETIAGAATGEVAWQESATFDGPAPDGWILIQYARSDKAAFDATHSAIIRSARFILGHPAAEKQAVIAPPASLHKTAAL